MVDLDFEAWDQIYKKPQKQAHRGSARLQLHAVFLGLHQDMGAVETVATDITNFKNLELGRINALAAECGNGLYIVRKLGLENCRPQRQTEIKRDGLYVLFNKDTVPQSFVDEFSDTLKTYKRTDAYQKLWEHYFQPTN